jgi:O-antigen/teichoic acid export membrane protein
MGAAWLGYLGSVLGYALTAARSFRAQAPLYGATLLAIVVGCMILIPPFGLVGAALAMAAGSVVQLAFGWAILHSALQKIPRDIFNGRTRAGEIL